MKIRNGFVSNSSSSSFLVIGKEINIMNITSKMVKEKKLIFLGDDLNEGQDVFQIQTIEELAFLKALNKIEYDKIEREHPFTILDSCVFSEDEYDGEIDVKNLPKTGKVQYFTGMMDYSSSSDLNTLIRRYDIDGEASKKMQKYLRAKKINKIENNEN